MPKQVQAFPEAAVVGDVWSALQTKIWRLDLGVNSQLEHVAPSSTYGGDVFRVVGSVDPLTIRVDGACMEGQVTTFDLPERAGVLEVTYGSRIAARRAEERRPDFLLERNNAGLFVAYLGHLGIRGIERSPSSRMSTTQPDAMITSLSTAELSVFNRVTEGILKGIQAVRSTTEVGAELSR